MAAALGLRGCGGEDLTYRREEGEVRTYLRTVVAEGRDVAGQAALFRSDVTTTERTVEVVPRRRYVSEVRFDRVRLEVGRGDGAPPLVSDSDAPPPEGEAAATPFAKLAMPARRLAGGTVTVRQDPRGMFEGFEGIEALRERMTKGLPEGDPARGAIEGVLHPGSLTLMLAPNLKVPPAPTRVGPVLHIQDCRPMPECTGVPGRLYYRGEFRLAGVKDGIATVEVSGDVLLDPPDARMPPWPPQAAALRPRFRLDRGRFRGSARIAIATGTLEEDEHVTELALFYVKPDGSGEVEIPAKRTQATKRVR